MADHRFPAPWLNGVPINAPNKTDLIDWYVEIDGYYPEATEHDSTNSILGKFRMHGRILCDDEFCPENTIGYDAKQTRGRVERVFRAIEILSKYKAALEDGADLSKSAIVDLGVVWRDRWDKVMFQEWMHNLQQFEDEIKNRSPGNSLVKEFWRVQRGHHSRTAFVMPRADTLYQYPSSATDETVIAMGSTCYHYDDANSQASQEPARLPTVLNPASTPFVPGSNHVSPTSTSSEDTSRGPQTPDSRPMNVESTHQNTELTNQSRPVVLPKIGQNKYNAADRYDEEWEGDRIFIPNLCSPRPPPSNPQPSRPISATPKPETEIHSSTTIGELGSVSAPEPRRNSLRESDEWSGSGSRPMEEDEASVHIVYQSPREIHGSGDSGDGLDMFVEAEENDAEADGLRLYKDRKVESRSHHYFWNNPLWGKRSLDTV